MKLHVRPLLPHTVTASLARVNAKFLRIFINRKSTRNVKELSSYSFKNMIAKILTVATQTYYFKGALIYNSGKKIVLQIGKYYATSILLPVTHYRFSFIHIRYT